MAINESRTTSRQYLSHHSDRGLQYCCSDYVTLLRNHFIAISMAQNGGPYENAIAERINGILKVEFGLYVTFRKLETAHEAVDNAIKITILSGRI